METALIRQVDPLEMGMISSRKSIDIKYEGFAAFRKRFGGAFPLSHVGATIL